MNQAFLFVLFLFLLIYTASTYCLVLRFNASNAKPACGILWIFTTLVTGVGVMKIADSPQHYWIFPVGIGMVVLAISSIFGLQVPLSKKVFVFIALSLVGGFCLALSGGTLLYLVMLPHAILSIQTSLNYSSSNVRLVIGTALLLYIGIVFPAIMLGLVVIGAVFTISGVCFMIGCFLAEFRMIVTRAKGL